MRPGLEQLRILNAKAFANAKPYANASRRYRNATKFASAATFAFRPHLQASAYSLNASLFYFELFSTRKRAETEGACTTIRDFYPPLAPSNRSRS